MPDIVLATCQTGRPRLDLPPIQMLNCFLEKTPGGPAATVRTVRPGLQEAFAIGAGPILRTFQKLGIFNNAVFNVSGGELYENQTLLGEVAYSTAPRFAAAQTFLTLVCGGALYIYNGSTFVTQTGFFDVASMLPPFSGCAVLYNIWIYPVVGSNQFFFSDVGNPGQISAGNFGAAQVSPTPIVEVAVLAEELYFFKTDTVEIWDFTGSLTAPFAESPGRTYARGCAAQGSVSQLDNSLFWVGDDFTVYRTSTVPQRVSTPYIDDLINEESNAGDISVITSYPFNLEGHVYYVLNLPATGITVVYDCETQQWFRWGTQQPLQADPGVWLPQTSAGGLGVQLYAGSSVDGTVYLIHETAHDDNGIPIQVVVSGAHWIEEGVARANNLALQMVRGVATSAVPDPLMWMRWTEDGGRTWTSWLPGSVGPIGGYRWKISWHSLGLIRQPGREFEFRISDPVNITIESATINPARR
jgi:Phage stabilisation protein